ncbi:MAG: IS21 family transposase, partial [Anaerolineae bacterium]|nr:IS21 family transposase [Anaerolineae bacterium]
SVLPYSNWEWGRVTQSESLAALHLGLQSALIKLGHIPEYHQTDNSSAATYWPGAKAQTGSKREYTDGYLQLLDHYGLKPRTINLNSPQENGDA